MMKVKDIIQLLEDLVFEIISWILFFPLTMVGVLIPNWASDFVIKAYTAEDPNKRYRDSISPILFYFIAAVITVLTEQQHNLSFDILENTTQTGLLISALQAFSAPFITALPFWVLLSLRGGKPVAFKKTNLRKLFEIQCMLWPVLYLPMWLIILYYKFFGSIEGEISLEDYVVSFFFLMVVIYFGVLQSLSLISVLDLTSLEILGKIFIFLFITGWFYVIFQYILPGEFVFSGLEELFSNP